MEYSGGLMEFPIPVSQRWGTHLCDTLHYYLGGLTPHPTPTNTGSFQWLRDKLMDVGNEVMRELILR